MSAASSKAHAGGFLRRPDRLILVAPVIFAIHVAEEAPGFVDWVNALMRPPITPELFYAVNAAGLLITLLVTAATAVGGTRAAAWFALGWLSFLMLANAIFHITAAAMQGGYAPGSVSAALLYLPFFLVFLRAVAVAFPTPPAMLAAIMLIGGLPMLVHGSLILFAGSRLL